MLASLGGGEQRTVCCHLPDTHSASAGMTGRPVFPFPGFLFPISIPLLSFPRKRESIPLTTRYFLTIHHSLFTAYYTPSLWAIVFPDSSFLPLSYSQIIKNIGIMKGWKLGGENRHPGVRLRKSFQPGFHLAGHAESRKRGFRNIPVNIVYFFDFLYDIVV